MQRQSCVFPEPDGPTISDTVPDGKVMEADNSGEEKETKEGMTIGKEGEGQQKKMNGKGNEREELLEWNNGGVNE